MTDTTTQHPYQRGLRTLLWAIAMGAIMNPMVHAQVEAPFSEDFSAGISAWTPSLPFGYSADIEPMALEGAHFNALRVTNNGQTVGGTLNRTFVAQTGYLRFYIKLGPGFFTQQPDNWMGINLLSVTTQDGQRCFALAGMKDGNENRFYIDTAPGGRPTWDFRTSLIPIREDVWYCLEFYLPPQTATTGVRWWVDGEEQLPMGMNFSVYEKPWGNLTLGLPEGAGFNGSVHYASIVMSNNYVGPIGFVTPAPGTIDTVRDGIFQDLDVTPDTKTLSANWDAIKEPLTAYEVAIGTKSGATDILNWTPVGLTTRFTHPLTSAKRGTKYFVSVRAVNPAGTGPVTTSDGQTYGNARVVYQKVTPNPLISRGKPVFASTDQANAQRVVDGRYDPTEPWSGNTTDWIAVNVGPGAKKVMLLWNATADESFVATYPTIVRDPVSPAAYTIETSADSTNGQDGKWSKVADVTDNYLRTRAHSFNFSGQSWVRITLNKTLGTQGVKLDEIDLHDISNGSTDSYIFVGDSITQRAMRRRPVSEQPSFAELIHAKHPGHFPVMINAGIGGDDTTDILGIKQPALHAGNIDQYLKMFPDIQFWCIGFGTNDSGAKQYPPDMYRQNLSVLVEKIKAAGKTPIIAQIPYNVSVDDASSPWRNIPTLYNPAVDDVTKRQRLLAGPDLFHLFRNSPWLLFSDRIHPSSAGSNAINQAWAEVFLPMYETK
jgi:acyl-CoA thioesterase I